MGMHARVSMTGRARFRLAALCPRLSTQGPWSANSAPEIGDNERIADPGTPRLLVRADFQISAGAVARYSLDCEALVFGSNRVGRIA